MDVRKLPWLPAGVLGIALVLLVLDAGGGPGWGSASAHAATASRLDRLASAPLYDVLAGVAALMPAGELGFRLNVLAALLGALTLAGVVAAARAVLPRDPVAGVVAAILLFAAAPFRDAAAFADPAMLAACGATWAIACAARRETLAALGCCAVVVGSAPWLGVGWMIAIALWLRRDGHDRLLIGIGAIGAVMIALWWDAVGVLPAPHLDLAGAIASSGHGAGAVVVGAGLLGAGFGAITGLAGARWLAALVAIAGAHEVIFGGSAAPLIGVLAVAAAIIPSAIVRAAAPKPVGADGRPGSIEGLRRHAITFAAGVPLVAGALAMGATIRVDDPGRTPTQLAEDLIGDLPAGPGVVIATRQTSWFALAYERAIAGARPDLVLAPPLPPREADVIAADALRANRIVGADAAAFGRLDVARAIPRGRGFQLVGTLPERASRVVPPARYATTIGVEQATLLALERARLEAASGRLDAAARAAGLAGRPGSEAEPGASRSGRFGAADLAVLAAAIPTKRRPALFGFLPGLDDQLAGPWLLDIFGDDLAWVAGLDVPALDPDAPRARRIHARWREIWLGKAKPDDPVLAALGATHATRTMLDELGGAN